MRQVSVITEDDFDNLASDAFELDLEVDDLGDFIAAVGAITHMQVPAVVVTETLLPDPAITWRSGASKLDQRVRINVVLDDDTEAEVYLAGPAGDLDVESDARLDELYTILLAAGSVRGVPIASIVDAELTDGPVTGAQALEAVAQLALDGGIIAEWDADEGAAVYGPAEDS